MNSVVLNKHPDQSISEHKACFGTHEMALFNKLSKNQGLSGFKLESKAQNTSCHVTKNDPTPR